MSTVISESDDGGPYSPSLTLEDRIQKYGNGSNSRRSPSQSMEEISPASSSSNDSTTNCTSPNSASTSSNATKSSINTPSLGDKCNCIVTASSLAVTPCFTMDHRTGCLSTSSTPSSTLPNSCSQQSNNSSNSTSSLSISQHSYDLRRKIHHLNTSIHHYPNETISTANSPSTSTITNTNTNTNTNNTTQCPRNNSSLCTNSPPRKKSKKDCISCSACSSPLEGK